MDELAVGYLVVVVFGTILLICWILLPFAMIGTKPLLRQLIAEQKRTNDLLERRLPDLAVRARSPGS